jgi:hypothetical protein
MLSVFRLAVLPRRDVGREDMINAVALNSSIFNGAMTVSKRITLALR